MYSKVASTAANPPRALGAVELSLRSYRNSESNARDLISSIWNVLEQNFESCATLVSMIVDILDDEDKKKDMLGAWNGFKIEVRPSPNLFVRRQWLIFPVSNAANSQLLFRPLLGRSTRVSQAEEF